MERKKYGCYVYPKLTNVVIFIFTFMVCIVDYVQGCEPKLIHLNDLEIASVVGAIPSMSSGQHSRLALHVAHET